MSPERHYTMPLTYWAVTARDEYGAIVFGAPAHFLGRWEDKSMDIQGPKGEVFTSRALIYTPESLNTEIDGWLFNGTSSATDPSSLPGAYRVRQLQTIPDLRNLSRLHIAIL